MTANNEHTPVTMNCPEVQKHVVAYLKGGLPAGRQEAFRRHLLECPQCDLAVQQVRSFDAELRLEAGRIRREIPAIPAEVSIQIQEKVYRRMRRALWFQRSFNAAQRAGAFVFVVVFLAAILMVFNPWRRQLAMLGTAAPNAVAVTQTIEAVPVEASQNDSGVEATPAATSDAPLPTVPPHSPTPLPVEIAEMPRPEAAQPAVIIARETPKEAAMAVINAAIAADDLQFALVVERTIPLPEVSFRVWRRLERCQGIVAADDLTYRVMINQGRFASIYVFNAEGQYLGDIKMWLDANGYWYLSSMNYSSFSALRYGCLQ